MFYNISKPQFSSPVQWGWHISVGYYKIKHYVPNPLHSPPKMHVMVIEGTIVVSPVLQNNCWFSIWWKNLVTLDDSERMKQLIHGKELLLREALLETTLKGGRWPCWIPGNSRAPWILILKIKWSFSSWPLPPYLLVGKFPSFILLSPYSFPSCLFNELSDFLFLR